MLRIPAVIIRNRDDAALGSAQPHIAGARESRFAAEVAHSEPFMLAQYGCQPFVRVLIDHENFKTFVRLSIEAGKQPVHFRHAVPSGHN
ncbi:MAG: hypothetical protein ABSD63_16330 [Candidatus Korobacteraceae bacterium]